MDMEEVATGTAQGDLADVVARAGAMVAAPPSTSHRPPPPPSPAAAAAADHMSPAAMAAAGQIMRRPYEEPRPATIAAVTMLEAPSSMVDPYLPSSSATAPRGGYWPQQQQLAAQISQQHACYGRDVAMADIDGDEAIRISPPAHQIIKRKNEVKKVVCIPALPPTSNRPGGGEVIPSDLWAWRKYGQKPIKGSPYPRGYYRCSSSKGCMARKQVERSRSDPNMLVITYTAEHNHPWPMQRNVLAGHSRPQHSHNNSTNNNCKKKNYSCSRVDPSSTASSLSSSPASSISSKKKNNVVDYYYSDEHNYPVASSGNLECHQQTTHSMVDAAGYVAYTAIGGALDEESGGVAAHNNQPMMSCGSSIQSADEVFAELEELDPSNHVNANTAYSRSVISYEWHNASSSSN